MKNTVKSTKKSKNIMLIAVLAAFCFLFFSLYYSISLTPVSKDSEDREIIIAKGSGLKAVARILKEEGLIRDNLVFEIYCKLNDKAGKIKAGKYYLKSSMSLEEITERLASGKAHVDTVRFTIPEGYELRQIIDKLDSMQVVDRVAFLEALGTDAYSYDFIQNIPNRENRLEGYLFPDTYEIFKGASADDIVGKMLGRFDEVYSDKYIQRAKELHMTMDQVITLASIIEREAKLDSERKLVSAVFHNRIKTDMRLQSCATVQYILKERKEVLTYKDVAIESPYNTYKYAGLPPGPIASPGMKSIEAALYPADVNYLYFVAKPDGSHIFTKTYKEHIAAQNKIKANAK